MQNARKKVGKRVAGLGKKQGFAQEKSEPLIGAEELSYYRPPTQNEFKRIEHSWRKTPDGKRPVKGSQVERLATYYDSFLSNAFNRVESLASADLSQWRREHEKKALKKALQLCWEIEAFHVRKQLSKKAR